MNIFRKMMLLSVVLFSTSAYAQTEEIFYSPILPQVELSEAKITLARILKETGNINHPKLIHITGYGNPKDVSVFEDRIELTINPHNTTIYFSDLLKYDIQIIQIKNPAQVNYPTSYSYKLTLGELEFWTTRMIESSVKLQSLQSNLKELADYLFYFQHQLNIKQYDSQLTLFEPIAKQFRALTVKPPVSEEQRKFIVQANSFNQEKQYDEAIKLFIKAIEVDQTAYPAAYSNLALLSAQINKFDAAICYMKKYLMLEPESLDARSAQDKIYEWEAKVGK